MGLSKKEVRRILDFTHNAFSKRYEKKFLKMMGEIKEALEEAGFNPSPIYREFSTTKNSIYIEMSKQNPEYWELVANFYFEYEKPSILIDTPEEWNMFINSYRLYSSDGSLPKLREIKNETEVYVGELVDKLGIPLYEIISEEETEEYQKLIQDPQKLELLEEFWQYYVGLKHIEFQIEMLEKIRQKIDEIIRKYIE